MVCRWCRQLVIIYYMHACPERQDLPTQSTNFSPKESSLLAFSCHVFTTSIVKLFTSCIERDIVDSLLKVEPLSQVRLVDRSLFLRVRSAFSLSLITENRLHALKEQGLTSSYLRVQTSQLFILVYSHLSTRGGCDQINRICLTLSISEGSLYILENASAPR